jgi:hypothetical protein
MQYHDKRKFVREEIRKVSLSLKRIALNVQTMDNIGRKMIYRPQLPVPFLNGKGPEGTGLQRLLKILIFSTRINSNNILKDTKYQLLVYCRRKRKMTFLCIISWVYFIRRFGIPIHYLLNFSLSLSLSSRGCLVDLANDTDFTPKSMLMLT